MSRSRKAKARALLEEALERAHEAFIRMNDTRELCRAALAMLAPPEPRPIKRPLKPVKLTARKRQQYLRRFRNKESIQ